MSEERKWIASDGSELKPGMMVLVRDHVNFNWRVNVFSHCLPENGCYFCAYDSWVMCIPLEGNECMTGTTFPVTDKTKLCRGDYVFGTFYDDDGNRHVRSGMYVDFVEEKKPTPHAVIYDYELQVSFCHECSIDKERNEGERAPLDVATEQR